MTVADLRAHIELAERQVPEVDVATLRRFGALPTDPPRDLLLRDVELARAAIAALPDSRRAARAARTTKPRASSSTSNR